MATAPAPAGGGATAASTASAALAVPEDIWNALRSAGASAQAAGIMGNAISESSLNPEAHAMDSNGYYSNGLWQFNEASYPTSGDLVTGNPIADLKAQVDFLIAHGGLAAASGTTVSETAGNFAAKFERCQGCAAGGAQNAARQANAATVAGWAAAGAWPATTGSASDTATLTAATSQAQAQGEAKCAWSVGWGGIADTSWLTWLATLGSSSGNIGSGEVCLLSKSAARSLIGTGLLLGGSFVMFFGLNVLAVFSGVVLVMKIAGSSGGKAAAVGGLAGKLAPAAAAAT